MEPAPAEDESLPRKGRLAGIDYGTKRVGIAVSDIYQEYSSPLQTYQRSGGQADCRFFTELVQEYRVVGFVVGLPVHMSGDESQKSKEAREYANWLTKLTDIPHAFQDERYSSTLAEAILMQADLSKKKRKARIDKLAAQILLQGFLDQHRPKQPAEADATVVDNDSSSDTDSTRQSEE